MSHSSNWATLAGMHAPQAGFPGRAAWAASRLPSWAPSLRPTHLHELLVLQHHLPGAAARQRVAPRAPGVHLAQPLQQCALLLQHSAPLLCGEQPGEGIYKVGPGAWPLNCALSPPWLACFSAGDGGAPRHPTLPVTAHPALPPLATKAPSCQRRPNPWQLLSHSPTSAPHAHTATAPPAYPWFTHRTSAHSTPTHPPNQQTNHIISQSSPISLRALKAAAPVPPHPAPQYVPVSGSYWAGHSFIH